MPLKPRRTQEERSASTRARLLDATIACLYELGYARTTTTEIVRRAGLSRGAQLHHFPTKAELVITAVEHLLARREREFRRRFAALPADADRAGAAIDLLWEMMQDPTFYAWLELAVAARTDPDLRERLAEVNERFGELVRQTFRDLFPDHPGPPGLPEVAPTLTFAVLQGLALDRIAIRDPARLEQAVALFRTVASLALAARLPGGAP